MLLVTFHGDSGGITNVFAYDTVTGQLNTDAALTNIDLSKSSELRALVYANSYLYVVNGAKHISNVMCFRPPQAGSPVYSFSYVCDFIAASFSGKKDHFQNSIAHPFSLAFNGAADCYLSNQDTNVVAQVVVSSNGQTGSVKKGGQSKYLNGLSICPKGGCVFLDGTFVASQNGDLPDVSVTATDIPSQNGGLSVSFDGKKVQNSVRDVAIFGGVLLVCDEPSALIRLYSLSDGTYLGSGPTLPANPTHLAVQNGGLYASAGNQLYWSALQSSPTPSGLCFSSILQAPPHKPSYKIGGISFGQAGTMYVVFQQGTGSTGSGAIYTYSVTQSSPSSPPSLTGGTQFAAGFKDTPEFVLYVPNP
jgi:hypothetical protein